jgi:hypothetical protein
VRYAPYSYLAIILSLPASAQPSNPLSGIEVRSIEVSDLTTDRIRFNIHLGGTAQRDVTLRALAFEGATLNDIPVFLPALSGRFELIKDRPFDAVEALQGVLYFRDLESLEPVRRMIRDKKADVRATIRLQPEFTLLQRLVLRTNGAWISTNLQRSVEVEVPGGGMGRSAALIALSAADSVWVLGRRGLEWRQQRDSFLQNVRSQYAPRVLAIESRYELRSKEGQRSALSWQGLGFVGNEGKDGQVFLPGEAVEPWLYEGAIADAIAAKQMTVVKGSQDIVARANSGATYSLKNGGLKIAEIARDRAKGISIDRKKIYAVRERGSTANVARLVITGLVLSPVAEAPVESVTQSVALFRLRNDTVEILILPATRDNGRIRLVDPVDSRAFGSPVIGLEGLIGVLLDQTTVASMRDVREKLNVE